MNSELATADLNTETPLFESLASGLSGIGGFSKMAVGGFFELG